MISRLVQQTQPELETVGNWWKDPMLWAQSSPPPHTHTLVCPRNSNRNSFFHFISLWGSLSSHSHKHSFSLWLWAACCALYNVNTAICRAKSGLRRYLTCNLKGERAQQPTATMRTSNHASVTNRMSFFFIKIKQKKNNRTMSTNQCG